MLIGAGLTASFGAGFLAACERSTAEPPDRGKILSDLSTIVIVPSYVAAAEATKSLESALAALNQAPSQDALTGARAAWKNARSAWKQTDAFLFGPANDLGLTGGNIDSAGDIAKVEALARATTTIDAASVGSLGADQRGFAAIETLLFDPATDDGAMLAAFQAEGNRRALLASTLGTDLRTKVDRVRDAWVTDYGNQLARAGRGSTVYAAERQGVDAVVNGLIAASEVLIALRLAKPLGIDKTPATPAPELVESPRSDVSIGDLLAVLDGIESVYLGQRGGISGLPLSAAVAERSPRADETMRLLLPKAKEAVRAIAAPLRTAVALHRDPVIAAHAAIRDVKRALTTEVAGALGTSVGFGVTDGD